jgi:hypothetical protein
VSFRLGPAYALAGSVNLCDTGQCARNCFSRCGGGALGAGCGRGTHLANPGSPRCHCRSIVRVGQDRSGGDRRAAARGCATRDVGGCSLHREGVVERRRNSHDGRTDRASHRACADADGRGGLTRGWSQSADKRFATPDVQRDGQPAVRAHQQPVSTCAPLKKADITCRAR